MLIGMIGTTQSDRRTLWESRLRTVGISYGVKSCPGFDLPMMAFTLQNDTVNKIIFGGTL